MKTSQLFALLCLSLMMVGCVAPVSGKRTDGTLFPTRKILVTATMGDESDRGVRSFEASLAEELDACGIEHQSHYWDQRRPSASRSTTEAVFAEKIKASLATYQPDALLDIKLVSTTQSNDLLIGNYHVRLTVLPWGKTVWQGEAKDGDMLGIDTRAKMARNIIEHLKDDSAIRCDRPSSE